MLPITRASLQSFCRTCLKEFEKPSKKQLTHVYNVEKSETLRKWLATICEAIKFRGTDDTFPRSLCHICYVKVRTFYEFRERALCSVEAVKELLAEDLEVSARKNLQMFCRTCLKKIKNTQNFTNIMETPNVAQSLQKCIGLDVESEEFVEFPQLVCLWCFKKLRNYVEFCEISLQSLEYLESVVGCGNSLESKTVDNPPCYEKNFIISPASNESQRIVLSDLLAAIRKSEPMVEQSTNSNINSPVREMIFVQKLPSYKADLYQEVIEMEESTNMRENLNSIEEKVNDDANGIKDTTPAIGPLKLRKSNRKRSISNQTAQTLDELKAADHFPCNEETFDKEPGIFEDTSDYEPPTTKLKIKRKITTKMKSKKATHRSLEPKPASKKIQCHQCNRTFNKVISCQAHIRYDHEGFEKPFQCEICKVGFRVYFYLKRHMREQHAKPTPDSASLIKITYECEICRKIFKRKDHLQDHHNQVHLGMRPFKCRTCEKTFGTRKTCRVHEMCHTGERPFGCDKCDKTFRQKCELRIHLEVHTENKELLCPICKRVKSSPEELAAHIEYHAATERHQCTKCGRIFKRSTHLSDHDKAVHLKLRPFKCSYCELSFALPKTCRTHERTHTGERPELCPLCDKSFKQRSVLMNHMKRYHPKEAQKAKK